MKILIISGGNHPYNETTPILENLLVENGHDAVISESANELKNKNFEFDLIIMNTLRQNDTNNDFSEEQKNNFKNIIYNGKGLLSIHISPASCPDWKEMRNITGGGWVLGESWHPPFGWFKVYVDNKNHPISEGITDFWTYDECYCGLDLRDNINTFMHGIVDDEVKPLGWTYEYGKGKIVNIALGHSGASQLHPMFQKLVTNSIKYVSN
tara:strand:- start:9236 stop:9865 length:630 start_codon:yes stop_codon:yes gene_type:complete